MTAQHTPGPWWVTDSGVRDGGGFICARIPAQRYEGQDERFEREFAERIANCRLIAAAPDMLAALRAVMDPETHWAEARRQVLTAIAKATGEST